MPEAKERQAIKAARRPIVAVGVLAAALTIGPIGGGIAKPAGESLKLTQVLFQTSSSGSPPVSGSNSAVGTSDGHIGRAVSHGTVRGTNHYPAFTGRWVMFDPGGAIDFSLTGHVVGPGSFAGKAKVTGGTGKYRRAGGTLAFTAHTQAPTGGQSSPVIVRRISGTLFLP